MSRCVRTTGLAAVPTCVRSGTARWAAAVTCRTLPLHQPLPRARPAAASALQAVQESENDKAEIVIVCEPEGMSLQMGGLHPRASLYEKPVNLEAAKQVWVRCGCLKGAGGAADACAGAHGR